MEQERTWADPLILKLEDLKLPPPPYPKRIYVRDDRILGFALALTERGKCSFIFECRIPVDGKSKSHRETFRNGRRTTLEDVAEARKWAAKLELQLQAGTLVPVAPKQASYDVKTLRRVVHEFLGRRGDAYRSRKEFLACFENHVFPTLGNRPMESLDRDVTTPLVDEVDANVGRHAAGAVAKNLNTVGRWYAKRTKAFVWPTVDSPLTAADRRTTGRRLENHEIASVWNACAECGTFGRLVRFLLLTGLRRNEAADLHRSEVAPDFNRLTLPAERVKTGQAFTLPLSGAAADILRSCPPGGHFFFPGNREPSKPYSTFSHGKAALDRRTNTGKWRLHDLRHSAQTIMDEAGVLPHVVDRVLNHSTPGMGGRYGHHNWTSEKLDALERLAGLIAKIVEGSATA